jgi:hypothetical protein
LTFTGEDDLSPIIGCSCWLLLVRTESLQCLLRIADCSPLGLITIGDEGTVVTLTRPAASLLLETAAASAREIFSIMADL